MPSFGQPVSRWSAADLKDLVKKKEKEGFWCKGKDRQSLSCSVVEKDENGIKEDGRRRKTSNMKKIV